MIIGIYGAYAQGNFGDDLMALICANEVLKSGHVPLVYGLLENACSLPGCQVTQDLNEFLKKSEKFIYGGGGLLTVKRITRSYQRAMRSDIFKIINHASNHNKKIGVFSIGSNGDLSVPPADSSIAILSTASAVTLRLNIDKTWPFMPMFAKSHPDIVLSIKYCLSSLFVQDRNNNSATRVAINVNKRQGLLSIPVLLFLSYTRNMEITYVAAHSLERGFGSDFQLPRIFLKSFKRFKNYRINNSLAALSEISNWEAIVSSKLHVGVAAMSLGATFFPYSNNRKVYAFFCDLGITSTCWRDACGFISVLFRLPNYRFNNKEKVLIDNAIRNSQAHLDAINEFIA
jgi:hypothetical protein